MSVVVGAGLLCGAMVMHAIKCRKKQTMLITTSNTVGIAADDICYIVRDTKTVRCKSGKEFTDVSERESALTGTPGHLSGPRYIGYFVSKPSTPSLMGSGKRIDFYATQS